MKKAAIEKLVHIKMNIEHDEKKMAAHFSHTQLNVRNNSQDGQLFFKRNVGYVQSKFRNGLSGMVSAFLVVLVEVCGG